MLKARVRPTSRTATTFTLAQFRGFIDVCGHPQPVCLDETGARSSRFKQRIRRRKAVARLGAGTERTQIAGLPATVGVIDVREGDLLPNVGWQLAIARLLEEE